MMTSIVMTLIGADRPGLVELVSACVADHGGNWLESRMCHLGGRFAGIARVEVPAEKSEAMKIALLCLKADGLQVLVDVDAGGEVVVVGEGVGAVLELVGQDRPGILRTIAGVLTAHGVNVEELSSECISAPMGGGNLFQARARVFVPAKVKLESVRADLEKIAADLMVDVTLQAGKVG